MLSKFLLIGVLLDIQIDKVELLTQYYRIGSWNAALVELSSNVNTEVDVQVKTDSPIIFSKKVKLVAGTSVKETIPVLFKTDYPQLVVAIVDGKTTTTKKYEGSFQLLKSDDILIADLKGLSKTVSVQIDKDKSAYFVALNRELLSKAPELLEPFDAIVMDDVDQAGFDLTRFKLLRGAIINDISVEKLKDLTRKIQLDSNLIKLDDKSYNLSLKKSYTGYFSIGFLLLAIVLAFITYKLKYIRIVISFIICGFLGLILYLVIFPKGAGICSIWEINLISPENDGARIKIYFVSAKKQRLFDIHFQEQIKPLSYDNFKLVYEGEGCKVKGIRIKPNRSLSFVSFEPVSRPAVKITGVFAANSIGFKNEGQQPIYNAYAVFDPTYKVNSVYLGNLLPGSSINIGLSAITAEAYQPTQLESFVRRQICSKGMHVIGFTETKISMSTNGLSKEILEIHKKPAYIVYTFK